MSVSMNETAPVMIADGKSIPVTIISPIIPGMSITRIPRTIARII